MAKRSGRVRLEFPPKSWRFSRWQQRVWEDSADLDGASVFDMCCGRGSGKDIVAIRCVLRDAFKLWGRYKAEQLSGEGRVRNPLVKVFVVAPQENNLKQPWDDWHGELAGLAREWRLSWADSDDPEEHGWFFRHVVRERKFVLFGRGEIEIEARLSSTRDSLRGPGVDLVHWTETAVETVPGELERAHDGELAGTMIRANRHGRIYRTTTPKGPFGGYHSMLKREFGDAVFRLKNDSMRSEDGLRYAYNFDSFSNEFLTEKQKAAIRAEEKLGWYYEQERLARFVIGDKGGSKVFARALVYGCVVQEPLPAASGPDGRNGRADDPLAHRRPAARGAKLRRIGFGVDIARYGDDFTCYCGVDQDTGEIVRLERKEHLSGRAIVTDIERLAKAYPGATFRVDSTGHKGYIADFLPSDLHERVIETEFSRQKEKWVLGLGLLFEGRQLRIPNPEEFPGLEEATRDAVRVMLRELLAFVKVIKQSGQVVFTHPPGENDDTVDALILATMELAERLPGTVNVEGTVKTLQRLNV